MTFLIFIFISFLIILLIFIPLSRWRLFNKRSLISMDDLYGTRSIASKVPFDFFVQMITRIAKYYHIKPGILRLDDCFEGNLDKFDSWFLGGGAEDVEAYILHDLKVSLPMNPKIKTVGELIEYSWENKKE